MENVIDFQKAIVRDMSEGVLCIGFDGKIIYVNEMAYQILEYAGKLEGQYFSSCFFEHEENDGFNQAVLDAVYDSEKTHKNIVTYYTGETTKHLNITTSYLKEDGKPIGIIVVLTNITELVELRDAVKAMQQIKSLNKQLELRNALLYETFGRYLSDEIVKQILETPNGLDMGGKKRNVTIMMVDLRGFTTLSEQMEPYALVDMLNHYLEEMTVIVEKRNGTLIEILGDGILVVFGAPIYTDTHAADAVAAAIEMISKMDDVNNWNKQKNYPSLNIGVGINTGDAIIGNIGSLKRTRYNIIGKNVNLCGRIESYTVGGQIFISTSTKREINTDLQIKSEHIIFPKGIDEAITLIHVTGIGAPYNLYCKENELPMKILTKQCPIEFYVIKEKHRGDIPFIGKIRAISEQEAMINTEAELALFDNIQFEININEEKKVFAKIIKKLDHEWLVRFTSTPSGFTNWINNLS